MTARHEPSKPLHLCRICRRPLNEFDQFDDDGNVISVSLHHAIALPGTPPHDPDPILASDVDNELVGMCDFCFAPAPTWTYACDSFDIESPVPTIGYGSVEDWAACEDCKRLIELGRWRQLANRTVNASRWSGLGAEGRRKLRHDTMRLHQAFHAARKGPPTPL